MNYKELSNIFKKINKWYGKKTKVLSVKTRPFNTIEIFSNIINKTLFEDKNILYVFCSEERDYVDEKKISLREFIDEAISDKQIESNLQCIVISEINNIDMLYDLVIFDDITLFSKLSNEYVREAVENIYWKSNKVIIYSSEFIFPIGEKIEIPYMLSEEPMIEPRLMSTRIRLEENIPLSLFEYFKWFKENRRIVLIVVPSEEKLNKVYNHYYEVLRQLDIRVVRYNKNQSFSFIKEIIDGYSDSLFIITNNCGQYMNNIPNVNIIVLFADDIYYSYKKIVYMCGSINCISEIQSELILVSKEISEEIDNAKNITREFNKILWEKQYLRS
ncbi:hypothetical protein [Clostridium sp. D53t1_180928_C8]|uniref:hypothetical protein n=1 Tax=Clostridium sp. D53t1_180928_C8 TaxID=2787101 RepID=UPI0018AA19E1|nr:hypothetical protein [Clostridium sp. D53t1_180928_C8]